MSTCTTEPFPVSIPDLLLNAGAKATHRHAAERILAIGRAHAPNFWWKRISHTGSRPSEAPSFVHFVGQAAGWDPDVVQLHLRWECPAISPAVPELSFEANVGVYEVRDELHFHAPKAALRERLEPQSLNPDHLESLVRGELARMRRPLLHLRLVYTGTFWRLAPQPLLSSWPLTLPRPADLRFAQERDAYRLIAWIVHALDGYRLLTPDL